MGLFEKLSRSLVGARKKAPEAVPAPQDPEAILAPVAGHVVALEADLGGASGMTKIAAFSQGMLGCGLGIRAEGDVAFAPVTGTVVADVKTKHALLIRAENGAEVLLHVGLDSVRLRGAGFRTFVRKGDRVSAGEPVMSFDRALMAERGLDDTVLVTVTNADAFSAVTPVCPSDVEVSAGAELLRCER